MARTVECPDCGEMVSGRFAYCPHCGASVRTQTLTHREPEEEPVDHPPRSGCRAFFVSLLIGLICGGAALAGYYYYRQLEPEVVVVTDALRQRANSYDELSEFYDGVARGRRGSETYFFDIHGNLVEMRTGNGANPPDETRLQRIEVGGRWGMIDRDTRDTVIRPIYSTLGNFHSGLALATLKFGDRSMEEYTCFYGYVDTRGNHTFTPECFAAIERARSNAERREYLASLPHGVTLRSLGLPAGLHEVTISQDSVGVCMLSFDRRGQLEHFAVRMGGLGQVRFGVEDGFVSSMTVSADGVVHRYRYLREAVDDTHETIVRQGADGQRQVGEIIYSAEDHTVSDYYLDCLPRLSSPGVTYTSTSW